MDTPLLVLVQNEILQQQFELYKKIYTVSITAVSIWYF